MTYPGGVGTLAYALCQYNPQMKITVCDLQPVVTLTHHFRPSVEDCPNQVNVSFMIGDFFKPETLPKADLYVLSRILHDWPEEKVELILDNVFNCLPSGKSENTAANIESLATFTNDPRNTFLFHETSHCTVSMTQDAIQTHQY